MPDYRYDSIYEAPVNGHGSIDEHWIEQVNVNWGSIEWARFCRTIIEEGKKEQVFIFGNWGSYTKNTCKIILAYEWASFICPIIGDGM